MLFCWISCISTPCYFDFIFRFSRLLLCEGDTCPLPVLRGSWAYSYCVCSNTSAAALQCLSSVPDCPVDPAPSTAAAPLPDQGPFSTLWADCTRLESDSPNMSNVDIKHLQSINRSKSPSSPEIWFIRPARQPNGPQPRSMHPIFAARTARTALAWIA